jgi:hypothetical protein
MAGKTLETQAYHRHITGISQAHARPLTAVFSGISAMGAWPFFLFVGTVMDIPS